MRPLRKNKTDRQSSLQLVKDTDDVFNNLVDGIIGLSSGANKKEAMKLIDKAISDYDSMEERNSRSMNSMSKSELSFLKKIMK